ncbi:MAG: LON peptidase substrate-binding domain-containing protein [Thermoprotei archaeon]
MTLIPLLPLTTVLYPRMLLPLFVCETKYRKLLRKHSSTGKALGIVLIKKAGGGLVVPYDVGTAAKVIAAEDTADSCHKFVIKGECKFRVNWIDYSESILKAEVEPLRDDDGDPGEAEELKKRVEEAFRVYLAILDAKGVSPPKELVHYLDPLQYSYIVADMLNLNPQEKQRLLAYTHTTERLKAELELLSKIVDKR